MIVTDNVNFWCTIVSIIVTLISICFSIWSFVSAKKAETYKKETLKFKDTLDLRTLFNQFIVESQQYQNLTRKCDWYKGIDVNLIISPFNKVLISFGSFYHLMTKSDEIKNRVHLLQQTIQQYQGTTKEQQKMINNYIVEISDLLQVEIQNRTESIITKKL